MVRTPLNMTLVPFILKVENSQIHQHNCRPIIFLPSYNWLLCDITYRWWRLPWRDDAFSFRKSLHKLLQLWWHGKCIYWTTFIISMFTGGVGEIQKLCTGTTDLNGLISDLKDFAFTPNIHWFIKNILGELHELIVELNFALITFYCLDFDVKSQQKQCDLL